MGSFSVTSQTAFTRPAEEIYDFVSNPANWGRTYKGSGGPTNDHLTLPLQIGDTWSEVVALENNTYMSTWTLITADRPNRWVFQQVNKIGQSLEGEGGVDGVTTISYIFTSPGHGITLFTRNLTCETPKGVAIPDDLLLVRARPTGIDQYHAAIEAELEAAAALL